MRTRFLIAFIALSASPAQGAEVGGKVSLHVWPIGQRAAREEITTFAASPAEYHKMLKSEWRPIDEKIFRGCFLARYTPDRRDRTPASAPRPARVCFSR